MLIISGLGRCGTSVIAKFCREVGFDPGGTWIPRVNAGFELDKVVKVNSYLRGGGELTSNDECRKHILSIKNSVIKDPRFFWKENQKIINFWWETKKDLKFMVLHRDFDGILKSREKYFKPEPWESVGEYQILFANALTEIIRLKIPYRTLFFPDFLSDYSTIYEVLTEFAGLSFIYEEGLKKWEGLIKIKA